MVDFMFKLLLGAIGIFCIALIALMMLVMAHMLVNSDKYECIKTGRQATSFVTTGKVITPITVDETVCKLKAGAE